MDAGLASPRTEGTPDDRNIYVRSKRAGERVMRTLEECLSKRLRLRVNRAKSAVERPWKRKFLGVANPSRHHGSQ